MIFALQFLKMACHNIIKKKNTDKKRLQMSRYCYDVFPQSNTNIVKMQKVMERHGFRQKENQYGIYFHIEVDGMDTAHIARILKRYKYKYRRYEKRWERNSNYRDQFFKYNHGPYHCAYCGKKLKTKDIEVDHLIPVAQTKKNFWAKFLLSIKAINNVNNPRNLVASCHKCNQKKLDKMGFWVLRGTLGRHKLFWKIWKIIRVVLVVIILYLVINYFWPEVIEDLQKNLLKYF